MLLIVECDEANVRTIRAAWERHGRPRGLRSLLEAEVAEGVQLPTRLQEGSAALALLWSMRMKRFWITLGGGIADLNGSPSTAIALDAYEAEVEPFHGFFLRATHRTAMRALPSRAKLIHKMGAPPSGRVESSVDRTPLCVRDLQECLDATRLVVDHVQGMLDDLGLQDPRRL